jgi:L-lactate dehydrogenase complex protein LldG
MNRLFSPLTASLSARERIMRRLASADFSAALPLPDVAAYYDEHARQSAVTPTALLAQFCSAMTAAHAEVHATDTHAWPDLLCRLVVAKGLHNLLVGADTPQAYQMAQYLRQTPCTAGTHPLSLCLYDEPVSAWREQLFGRIQASLSRARSAIADTGSLVIWTNNREPRLLSLVPPVHFVLLDADRLHANLHAAMQAENWSSHLPTNALLISGPSKTADIQQTLAYGAHGPRELIVLLCHATPSRAQP